MKNRTVDAHMLTEGGIASSLILFTLPMMAGNILQQMYNITDTLIVGRFIGSEALAAVGSSYSLMTLITSIFLGLSMGSSTLFSICFGRRDMPSLKSAVFHSFLLVMALTIAINALSYALIDGILVFLRVPDEIVPMMKDYLLIIFSGIAATSAYNFLSCFLRSLGNSVVPLVFLAFSTALNIFLDLLFIVTFGFGVKGAAWATVISQFISALGIAVYALLKFREFLPDRSSCAFDISVLKEIFSLSTLTCLQQTVMNFGILMVQGLVNSFGATVMAAFASSVKIDTLAYLPVQDFGNAYSVFVSQNYGSGKVDRIKKGTRIAFSLSAIFSAFVSLLVFVLAPILMSIFTLDQDVIREGVLYLRTEGACYVGIGCLFLFYGHFRAIKRAGVSLVLTVISLGLRVALAYLLSSFMGVVGIWVSIPMGWAIADAAGYAFMRMGKAQ